MSQSHFGGCLLGGAIGRGVGGVGGLGEVGGVGEVGRVRTLGLLEGHIGDQDV